MPQRLLPAWPLWVMPLCLGVAAACLCGDALLGDRVFAWRDAVHTFPGLVELAGREWRSGSVPLWNPLLNSGQPLAGMNVAGIFYPPNVIAAVLLPVGAATTVIVVMHLVLAGWAAAGIARDTGHSPAAATVAGLAYAFCGSVAFQAYHPNIAAGAAWLAWSVRFGTRLSAHWSLADMVGLAASLAFTILAGDPQAAYLAGIVLAIHAAVMPPTTGHRALVVLPAFGRLATSAAVAAALAWPQIALTSEFMATTTRYADAYPVSVWDLPRCLGDPDPSVRARWADVIIGRPPAEASFYHQIYRFSVAPWRLLDLLSPTLAGPLHGRWTVAAGLEGDVWVASLYAGVIPLACAVVALTARPWSAATVAWVCIAGFSYVASLGGFGMAGAVRHASAWVTSATPPAFYEPGDEVGGIAWLLTTFVPGYAGFRSPGKWLACFALAGGQLAAVGFDTLGSSDRAGRRRIVGGIAAYAAAATIVACLAAPANDRSFIAIGGLLAIASAAVAMVILDRPDPRAPKVAFGLAVLTAADLALAGRTVIESAPLAAVRAGSGELECLADERRDAAKTVAGHPRLVALDGAIDIPQADSPTARARAVGIAERCNTPLLHGWGKVGEPGTAMEGEMELLCSPLVMGGVGVFPRRTFDRMAVEFFLLPATPPASLPMTELLHDWSPAQHADTDHRIVPAGPPLPAATPPALPSMPAVTVVRNESAMPRARITRRVTAMPPLPAVPRTRRVAALARVAFPRRDGLHPEATLLEVPDPRMLDALANSPLASDPADRVRITGDEPRLVVVEAELEAPGVLVLADTFHPDWTASVRSGTDAPRPIPILRADHVLRGVVLPVGRHVVEFRHRSATFARSWPVAAASWAAVLIVLAAGRRRPPRHGGSGSHSVLRASPPTNFSHPSGSPSGITNTPSLP